MQSAKLRNRHKTIKRKNVRRKNTRRNTRRNVNRNTRHNTRDTTHQTVNKLTGGSSILGRAFNTVATAVGMGAEETHDDPFPLQSNLIETSQGYFSNEKSRGVGGEELHYTADEDTENHWLSEVPIVRKRNGRPGPPTASPKCIFVAAPKKIWYPSVSLNMQLSLPADTCNICRTTLTSGKRSNCRICGFLYCKQCATNTRESYHPCMFPEIKPSSVKDVDSGVIYNLSLTSGELTLNFRGSDTIYDASQITDVQDQEQSPSGNVFILSINGGGRVLEPVSEHDGAVPTVISIDAQDGNAKRILMLAFNRCISISQSGPPKSICTWCANIHQAKRTYDRDYEQTRINAANDLRSSHQARAYEALRGHLTKLQEALRGPNM